MQNDIYSCCSRTFSRHTHDDFSLSFSLLSLFDVIRPRNVYSFIGHRGRKVGLMNSRSVEQTEIMFVLAMLFGILLRLCSDISTRRLYSSLSVLPDVAVAVYRPRGTHPWAFIPFTHCELHIIYFRNSWNWTMACRNRSSYMLFNGERRKRVS